jgi:hypothetical protein
MNINYTQELHDAVNSSNDQLIQAENKLGQAKSEAKLLLYYARENVKRNKINVGTAKEINVKSLSLDAKSVDGVSLANNVLIAAKQSSVDTGSATSNISTTAANIQIAANAITKLASDVASILAVANASDQGSKIQASVEKAYVKVNKAAEMAEKLSLISLQATIEAAQSTASTVVTDAEQVLAAMTNLQMATSSQSNNSSEQLKAAHERLLAASKMAKSATAAYELALSKDQAMKSTRELINQVSNPLTQSNLTHLEKPLLDLTAQKAATINKLIILVEDAKRALAEAEATYESVQAKSDDLDSLLKSATDGLTIMTDQNSLALDVSQEVNSLAQTTKVALQTANKTYSDTQNLLKSAQQVVDATISAATEITLTAQVIMKAKASNALISSELVTQASVAATNANKAVSLIIIALTSTFNALSSANQANNTLETVIAEVSQLKKLVVSGDVESSKKQKMPIASQISAYYTEAKSAKEEAQETSDAAQRSVIDARDNLTLATTKLSNAEASLSAAEAAVGG